MNRADERIERKAEFYSKVIETILNDNPVLKSHAEMLYSKALVQPELDVPPTKEALIQNMPS
jgi:hypothetical protein